MKSIARSLEKLTDGIDTLFDLVDRLRVRVETLEVQVQALGAEDLHECEARADTSLN